MNDKGIYESLDIQQSERTVHVTIHWPERGGSLTAPLIAELDQLLSRLEDEDQSTLVVLRGLGTSDLEEAPLPDLEDCRRWEKMLVRVDRLKKVSLAVINGACMRFSAQLAIACDYRLATRESRFYMPELREGYLPGMSTFRLAKYAGLGVAKRLVLLGEPLPAVDALGVGIVDALCESGALESDLITLTAKLSKLDAVAAQLARRLLNESFSTSFEDAIGHYIASQRQCLTRLKGSNAA